MYQIYLINPDNSTALIYDQTQMNSLPVIGPKLNLEVNEAGSLSFTILPGHPLYNSILPLESYVKVLDDNEEIFYGRVLQRGVPTLTGQVQIQCEGALAFLMDSEVPPDQKVNGNAQSRTLTAEAFFNWCIEKHNDEVNDVRRQFTVGTVSADEKNKQEEYSISNYTETKGCINSNVTDVYGGMLRVREKDGGGHYIDWIQQYETLNPQAISIGVNLKDQTNQFDGDQLYTVIRPVGKDNLLLDEETIDLYSAADIAKYGRIVKTIEFKNAENKNDLRTQAMEYINLQHKTLFINSHVQLVDMHYLDGTIPKVHLGDRFNNIVGLEGTEMLAFSLDIGLDNAEDTVLELKNPKSMNPEKIPGGNRHAGSGKMSRSHAKSSGLSLKYYSELQDLATIDVPNLKIQVSDLDINVRNQFRETASTFERISSRVATVEGLADTHDRYITNIRYDVEDIKGSAVFQNSDFISSVVGHFEIWEPTGTGGFTMIHLKDGAELAVDDVNGGTITVGGLKGQVVGYQQITDTIVGSALWTQRDQILGVAGTYDIVYDRVPDPDNQGQYLTRKRLHLKDGAELSIDGVNGTSITFGSVNNRVTSNTQTIENITGSTLWTQRDQITGVSGEFDVVYTQEQDPDNPGHTITRKTLVVKSGGGMKIEKDGVQYGLYKEGDLTAGLLCDIINGNDGQQQTVTYIKGDKVIVGNMGSLSGDSVETWMQNAYNGQGVFAKYLTVKKLTAQEIQTMFADIDTAFIKGLRIRDPNNASGPSVTVGSGTVTANRVQITPGGALALGYTDGQSGGYYELTGALLKNVIKSASVDGDTLTLVPFSGPAITFRKAASISSLVGSWSGSTLTVSTNPSTGKTFTIGFDSSQLSYDANLSVLTNGTPTLSQSNSKYVDVPLKVVTNEAGTPPTTTSRYEFSMPVNATAAWNAGNTAGSYSGKASVTLNDPTWNAISGSTPTGRTVTVSTSGRTNESGVADNLSKSVSLYLTKGSWSSSNKLTVSMRTGSTSGTVMASTSVDASSIYTTGYNAGNSAGQLTGWSNAYAKVSLPGSGTRSSITVKTPASSATANPNQNTNTYTLSVTTSYAYLKNGSTTIARKAHSYKYTQAQYDDNWSAGFDAGVPTGLTLGSKKSSTTWNFTIARGSYASVSKSLNLSTVYADARAGYYTSSQYEAHYREGYIAGWEGYYNDSHWQADYYRSSTGKYECWIPAKTVTWDGSKWVSNWDYAKGENGWFQYTNGGGGSSTTYYDRGEWYVTKTTGTTGIKTATLTREWSATQSWPTWIAGISSGGKVRIYTT